MPRGRKGFTPTIGGEGTRGRNARCSPLGRGRRAWVARGRGKDMGSTKLIGIRRGKSVAGRRGKSIASGRGKSIAGRKGKLVVWGRGI